MYGYQYLYRTMGTPEYYHLRKYGYVSQTNGHQGLGPNRKYSYGYLDGSSYTHLIEFTVPQEFRLELYRQGWKDGSGESDCMAWGIGAQHKNSWMNNALGGVRTAAKSKNLATPPYDIYKDLGYKVMWKVVNLRVDD